MVFQPPQCLFTTVVQWLGGGLEVCPVQIAFVLVKVDLVGTSCNIAVELRSVCSVLLPITVNHYPLFQVGLVIWIINVCCFVICCL